MPPQSGLGELANRFVPEHAPLDLGGGGVLRLETADQEVAGFPRIHRVAAREHVDGGEPNFRPRVDGEVRLDRKSVV